MAYLVYRFNHNGKQDNVVMKCENQQEAEKHYLGMDKQIALCIKQNQALRIGAFPDTVYCIGPEALRRAYFSIEYHEGEPNERSQG